ncbi:YSIRK-type signal peptide-containing protein, partial [Lactobacillus amylovorus]
MNNRRNLKENLTISNKQRFSIRKFSIGVASVMLGTTLYFMGGVGPSIVHADSVDQPVQTQTSKDINSAQASSDATLAQQDSDQNQSQVSSVQNDEKTTNDQTAVKSSQQATNASAVKSNTQDSKKSVSDTNETKSVANKAQTSDQLATATSDKSSQQVAKTGTKNSNTLDIKQNKQRLAGNVKLNALTDNKAQTDTQTNSKYSVTDNYPADLTNYLPSTFNNKQEYAFEWLRTENGKNIILTTNRTGDGVVYVYQDRKKVGKLAQNKSLDLDFGADVDYDDYGDYVDYGEYTGTVYNDTMSGFVQSNPVKVDESPFPPDYHYNKLTVIYSSHAKDVKKGSFYTGISFFVPHKITQTVTYKNSNDQVIDRLTHTQDGLTGQSYTTGLPSGSDYVRADDHEYLDNITNNSSGLISEFYNGYSCTKDYHDGVKVTFTENDSEGTGTMDYVIYDGDKAVQSGSLAYGQSTNYTNYRSRYTIVNPYVPQTTNIVYQYKKLGQVITTDPSGNKTWVYYANDQSDPTKIEPVNAKPITGYSAIVKYENKIVSDKNFKPTNLGENTYITYSANAQKAGIKYIDDDTKETLSTDTDNGKGKFGQ